MLVLHCLSLFCCVWVAVVLLFASCFCLWLLAVWWMFVFYRLAVSVDALFGWMRLFSVWYFVGECLRDFLFCCVF